MFYNRTVVIDQATIDFSFLLACFIMIFLAWGIKFAVEYLELAENKYDTIYQNFKQKSEKLFNVTLEQEYHFEEKKNNKTSVLIRFNAINLAKDSHFSKDTHVGVEEMEREVLSELIQTLSQKLVFKKRVLDNAVFLYFDTFKNVETIIDNIENVTDEIKQKYLPKRWQISSCIAIETYSNDKDINEKNKNLLALIKLNLKNKIVCFATFKQRFSLLSEHKYELEQEGLYSINGSNEEVFYVKILR